MRTKRLPTLAAAALILGVVLAGCSGSDDTAPTGDEETSTSSETTETSSPDDGGDAPDDSAPPDDGDAPDGTVPDEGETPDDTTPEGEEDGSAPPADGDESDFEPGDVPVWTWILAGIVVVAAVAWMVTSSRANDEQAGNPEQ